MLATELAGVSGIGAFGLMKMLNLEANQFWADFTGGSETGYMDASDAFRHAYVSARFAQYFGNGTPNFLGWVNEIKFKEKIGMM